MLCSDPIDVSQYVSASMVENPWAALEKQHQRQSMPPPAAKPLPSSAAAGPSLADALAGAVQVRPCCRMHVCFVTCAVVVKAAILSCRQSITFPPQDAQGAAADEGHGDRPWF